MLADPVADCQLVDHPVGYLSSLYPFDGQLDPVALWKGTDGVGAVVRLPVNRDADVDELSGFEIRFAVFWYLEKEAFRIGRFSNRFKQSQ